MSNSNNNILGRVLVFCVATFALAETATASESIDSLKEFVQSIWGRVVIYVAILVVMTGLLYVKLRMKFAEDRAVTDLKFMSRHASIFEWGHVKSRISDCFYRFHSPWRIGDNDETNIWMSDTYWRDFKTLFLERIEKDGLVNVCNVKTIHSVKPVLFVHRNVGGKDERSKLVVCITAKLRNYLASIETGNLIEGSKEYQETKTVWSFEVVNGNWVISDVEDIKAYSDHMKLAADLPKIEDTLLKPVKIMTAAE